MLINSEELLKLYPSLDISRLPEGYLDEVMMQANATERGLKTLLNAFKSVASREKSCVLTKDRTKLSFGFENDTFIGGIIYYASDNVWGVHT